MNVVIEGGLLNKGKTAVLKSPNLAIESLAHLAHGLGALGRRAGMQAGGLFSSPSVGKEHRRGERGEGESRAPSLPSFLPRRPFPWNGEREWKRD